MTERDKAAAVLDDMAALALFRIAADLNDFGATRDEVNAALADLLPHIETVRIRHLRRHARRLDEPNAPTVELQ